MVAAAGRLPVPSPSRGEGQVEGEAVSPAASLCLPLTPAPLPQGERGEDARQTYPIFFFHSASCSRIVFQFPAVTFGTYGSLGIVVPQPMA